ncbi:alpha/beta fold hydrolase [uncultured Kocuria sp.]|uniref:alpha/beta fold hydrolase n=1 Tax=uncultured Kocuria sp. TaxID=259305 RepID=UPI00262FEA11|nr:alpha/beta fold hydrolase [uncultured Kocuria sp.]
MSEERAGRAGGLRSSARGNGPHFVLLHPGGTDSRALDPVVAELTDRYRVITPDQRGHGRTPDREGPLSYTAMAEDTIAFLGAEAETPVHLLGYSDGAVIALTVALRRPDLVRDLVVAAGVYHHDGWEPGVLQDEAEAPDFMADAYAEVSPDGREHYGQVVAKLRQLHAAEPACTDADLAGLDLPVLVLVGDDDEVRLEHAVALYRALPHGELAVVPHASHGVLVEKPQLCARLITDFHAADKPATLAPRRRRPGS